MHKMSEFTTNRRASLIRVRFLIPDFYCDLEYESNSHVAFEYSTLDNTSKDPILEIIIIPAFAEYARQRIIVICHII
jgi:hypothetical protein